MIKIISRASKSKLFLPVSASLLLALSRLPLHLGFLVFWGLIPLFSFFNENRKAKEIILSAFIFSSIYTLVALHWIGLATFPGFLALFLLFGFYFSILFILLNLVWNSLPKLKYIAFICFWMSFEFLQNFGEFRFPWFNIGYSLSDYLPVIQPAEIGGIYLLSFLIIVVNILIFELKNNFKRNLIILSTLMIFWTGFGFVRLNTIELHKTGTSISIVQISIPQKMKWKKNYLDITFQLYRKFSLKAMEEHPSLIIWPESATPLYLLKNSEYKEIVKELAKKNNVDIFTGFPHYQYAGESHPNRYKFYNAATLFDRSGKIHKPYHKNILVPFGERMPFLKIFPFLWKVQFGQANWEYGEDQEYYEVNGYSFSPLICFEIVFEKLTTKMAQHNVDFIVNITNDAWFKKSAGTYQHAVMTKFRAIETRRQIYRAANTGYSLVVSPTGEYLQESRLFEKTTLNEELLLYPKKSFFTKYLFWLPIVFVVGGVIILGKFLFNLKNKK
ncbi:MAG: apolipoprotein N-acyltransferase [Candidatus Cloacimonetes bacterium]|nr:apolipoprotein N-acyltransferase [Candidatus Cloacimonadota bacterium]